VQVPSSEAVLAEGALSPQARRTSPSGGGGVEPSSEAGSARGGVEPSSEANPARGVVRRATLAGRRGHQGRDRVVCFRFVG
jgi:hypothetical protein